MNHPRSRHLAPRIQRCVFTSLLTLGFALTSQVHGSTYYWDGTGTSWNNAGDWSSTADGTGTGAIPGSGDIASFSSSNVTTAQTVNLDGNQSALGLSFISPAGKAVTLNSGSGGTYSLTLGTSGISVGSGAAAPTINAALVLNGSQTWANSGTGTLVLNGNITGTGNLSTTGTTNFGNAAATIGFTGSLTLGGNTDFSNNLLQGAGGGVIINYGVVGSTGVINTSNTITLGTAVTWYNNNSNVTLSGSVLGGRSLNMANTGSLTLSGATDNPGLSVTTSGSTFLGKTSSATVHAIGGTLAIATGNTVQITGTGGDQIADTGTVQINSTGVFDLNGNNETIDVLTGNSTAGSVKNTASGTTGTLTIGANGGSATFSGTLQDGGGIFGLTKVGSGTETLTGASTFSGVTTVNGGTLALTGNATANASLSSSSALALGGGTLSYAPAINGTASTGATQAFVGTTINAGFSAVGATAGNTVALGALTRNAGGVVDFSPAGTGTVTTTSGTLTNGLLGTYASYGSGTNLSYATAASGTGAVAISAYTGGTTASTAAGITDTTGTINYNLAAGGTVGSSGASANTVRYTGAAGGISGGPLTLNGLMQAGTGTLTVSSAVNVGSNNELVITSNTQNTTLSGAIGNNGTTASGLTYGGPSAGTLTLGGANTYTGATQLNSGTTTVTSTGNLGVNSAVTLTGPGTSLVFAAPSATVTLPTTAASYSSSGDHRSTPVSLGTGGSYQNGGNNGGGAQPDYILIDLGKNYSLNSLQVTLANNFQTLQFYTANSSTGPFSNLYTSPTGSLDGTGSQPNVLNLSNFTADSSVFGTGTSDYGNGTKTFTLSGVSGEYLAFYVTKRVSNNYGIDLSSLVLTQALSGAAMTQTIGSLASAERTSSVSLASNVILDAGSNNASTTFAGVISGAGNLTKSGTGTMTLSGTNTYTGATTVNAGTLSLLKAGAISGTTVTGGTLAGTAVTVNSGGTLLLSANNALAPASALTLGGGTLSIGSGVLQGQGAALSGGTASGTSVVGLGALTLTANSSLNFADVSGTVVHGSFAPGTFTLNVTGSNFGTATTSADGATDRLIFAADESANLNSITFNGVADAAEVALGNGFYEIIPNITAVPEPATWAAGLLCVGVFAYRLRRKIDPA